MAAPSTSPTELTVRRCPQCGATVEADPTALSARCAFCETPLVDVREAAEPVERVVSFAVPRDRASRLLRGFLQGHWLAPEALRKAAKADELRAVLVPFYAYDAIARTRFSADVGIHWQRTETYTTWENGKLVTKTRTVTETEWFPLSGGHGRAWSDHLVSASRGLTEQEANALEPFDLGRALPFAPALTAGLEAEHPTIPHEDARKTALAELRERERRVIASDHLPGDKSRNLVTESAIELTDVELLLLPVWIAAVRGPKGVVRLLVNGQTGEVVGAVPRSGWKVALLVVVVLTLVVGPLLLMGGGVLFVALLDAMGIG